MEFPVLNLPRPVPTLREREPQANIPKTRHERERIKLLVERYIESVRPVPPLTLDELRAHSDAFVERNSIDAAFRDYAAVLINSEMWRDQLATVPYDRRLLLLPKCLRVEDHCPAPFDEFGLLCKQCGLCSIQDLQLEAERLGYAVLVAEGSAIVMALIQTGKIDAIVGVSCLSVLERAFPLMEAAAIPGVAIPLLQDDCKDTTVDLDWIWDVIHLTSADKTRRMDLDSLRQEVQSWFEPASLDEIFGSAPVGATERIAREWLGRAGKRWRPFLSVCAWKALQDDPELAPPPDLRKIAVAVECFHKASLIHDDIEDGDLVRYGEKTLHAEHGLPFALNVGDLLVGEGYRLVAECDAPPEVRAQLIRCTALGHRTLCLGQGAELGWVRSPLPLTTSEVLGIFRQKTAPAFQVALELGAGYAGAGKDVYDILAKYSDALGIAYQIRDDLEDWRKAPGADDLSALRPTLPMAIALERTKGDNRLRIESAWRRGGCSRAADEELRALLEELAVEDRSRGLLDAYKEEAIRSLAQLHHPGLKSLLRRVIGKIFTLEVRGWCSEFETRNAAGREAVTQAAP